MRQPREHCRLLVVALALLHFAVLVWQAPHLVHHAFETDTLSANECALASAAEHGPASIGAPAPDAPVHHAIALGTIPDAPCQVTDRSIAPSRAPPSVLA
jgi:hypothetical protein